MLTCTHPCARTHACTHTHTITHRLRHTHTYTLALTRMHTHTSTRMHAHACTHTHEHSNYTDMLLFIGCFPCYFQVIVNLKPENLHAPYFALDMHVTRDVSETISPSDIILTGMLIFCHCHKWFVADLLTQEVNHVHIFRDDLEIGLDLECLDLIWSYFTCIWSSLS